MILGIAPVKRRSVKAGDYFGERAVIYNEPRGATIVAANETRLWI